METNIKEIIYEYEKNKNKLKKYKSYINQVTEYEDYIIKEYKDRKKAENELMWLKKLNALDKNSIFQQQKIKPYCKKCSKAFNLVGINK